MVDAGRVYTIHNLALQGNFDSGFAHHYGIAPTLLAAPEGVDPGITYSAMAQGILHADRVNTVSDTYAKEILTPEYGAGLDPLLRARQAVVSGIVNGIDYEEFNPETDPHIADALQRRHARATASRTSARCRTRRGCRRATSALLFGVVTRLFAQKGIDLVATAFDHCSPSAMRSSSCWAPAMRTCTEMLLQLEEKYPDKVKIWLDFNPPLGQQIYAGCDVFLMPSRYEPCGLGQLISLRYGAVPLVRRRVGSRTRCRTRSPDLRAGTGFVFEPPTRGALDTRASGAIAAFENRPAWRAMQERGMRQDWSWGRAAEQVPRALRGGCRRSTAGAR